MSDHEKQQNETWTWVLGSMKQGLHLFHIKTSKSNQNVPIKDKHIHYTFPIEEELNFISVQ
jgi:hypothetical protein